MSSQRLTIGMIALLKNPIPEVDWETVTNDLYNKDSRIRITYGGEMVVYIHKDTEVYDMGIEIFDVQGSSEDFDEELMKAGLEILTGSKKSFVDNWYDGADAGHIDLSPEDAGYIQDD